MNNLYKLTKEELILKCKRLQSENKKLKDEIDNLSDCYTELENKMGGETVGILQRICENKR